MRLISVQASKVFQSAKIPYVQVEVCCPLSGCSAFFFSPVEEIESLHIIVPRERGGGTWLFVRQRLLKHECMHLLFFASAMT